MDYITFVILTLAIGLFSTWRVNHQLKKYSRVSNSTGMTGADCARQMLAYYGIYNVAIHRGGHGQDFFDPRSNSVTLSPEAYDARTVTAIATACHEVGHACQYAQGYAPMKVRGSLVPVVNMASNAWMFVFLAGVMLGIAGLYTLAIVLYAAVILFHVVTLPVEFDASKRAMVYMGQIGLSQADRDGSAKVLRACAFTYVAAALTSLLQLLWMLGMHNED